MVVCHLCWTYSNVAASSLGAWQAVRALRRGDLPQTFSLWQLRLVVELWDSRMLRGLGDGRQRDALLTTEFLPVMKNTVDVALDDWLRGEGRRRPSHLQGQSRRRNKHWIEVTTCADLSVHFSTEI